MKLTYLYIILIYFTSNNIYSQEKLFGGFSKISIIPENKKLFNNKKINDTLYSKTIILNNSNQKIALITVDSQGIPQFIIEEVKRKINYKTSFPLENIVITSTHTHSGIIASTSPENFNNTELTEYQLFLINTITDGFILAYKKLIPVQIAWGKFDKPEYVFNRRWYTKNLNSNPIGSLDSVKMNPGRKLIPSLIKPAGPTDPQISFIAIRSLDKTPLAILANYSLHYVGGNKKDEISADYFGKFDIEINKLLNSNKINKNFLGVMTNGTSGDINNHDYSVEIPTYLPYEKMTIVAKNIAENMFKIYNQLEFKNWIPIEVISENIFLEKRKQDNKLTEDLKKISQNYSSKSIFHKDEKYYFTRIQYYNKTYPDIFEIPLQVIRLDDLIINTIPFEVFVETGLDLKKKSIFSHSFTIGIANGHWGYLPTYEQHQKGGYETWITVNRVEKNSANLITDRILEMQKRLKKR